MEAATGGGGVRQPWDQRIHVYIDEYGEPRIRRMTDQEAYEYDIEHYGELVALENWRALQEGAGPAHYVEANEG